MSEKMLPEFIRRDVERAIEAAIHPKGMNVHDGKALIAADRLQYMLNFIDALRTHENGGKESGSVQDAVDKFRALLADCTESEIQQAKAIFCDVLGITEAALRTHENESEAGAEPIYQVYEGPTQTWMDATLNYYNSAMADGSRCRIVYLIPPSAKAIETAAIMKCAEEVFRHVESDDDANAAHDAILALIPQDGWTNLEEFGMKVGTEMLNQCGDIAIGINELHAIVTNLIGAAK